MYYEVFQQLCDERGVRPGTVSKATGVSTATLTNWKQGKYTPKPDKLQKIADYFGVSLDYLMNGRNQDAYYVNPETAKIAQKVFDDPELRLLFEAAQDVKPENIKLAAEMLRRFKETNA